MKKLHDRSTAWCEPSGSTNSDRQRRGIRERILLRGSGSGKVLNRIRVTLWARPAWGSLPCPASFLILRPCLPSPSPYARAHSCAAGARWTLVVRRRRKPEGGRFQRRPRRAETIAFPKFTLAAAPGVMAEVLCHIGTPSVYTRGDRCDLWYYDLREFAVNAPLAATSRHSPVRTIATLRPAHADAVTELDHRSTTGHTALLAGSGSPI